MNNKQQQYSQAINQANRWVIKVGSSLVTNNGRGLDKRAISGLAHQLGTLVQQGKEVILVSSGAIAEGMSRLGWKSRPHAIHELQAAAAIGQMGLIQAYETCLQEHQLHSAQVLLTHDDLQNRKRYLNARTTLRKLMQLKTIPVVNENDTVSTEEIKFGDNDTLAALVSNLVEANVLVILTDQEGVYKSPPDKNNATKENKIIHETSASDPLLDKVAGPSTGELGRGGMLTKISAARIAARAGAATIITSGKVENILLQLAENKPHGTYLYADAEPIAARKQWIANQLHTRGQLKLDAGASEVICQNSKSLLGIGVISVDGSFERGEVVSCVNHNGKEIAKGLVNYSAQETRKLMGQASQDIESILGYANEPELIHRDNLVVL